MLGSGCWIQRPVSGLRHHFFMIAPNEILEYWFEGLTDQDLIIKKQSPYCKWFRANPQIDVEIKNQFGHQLEQADQRYFTDWEDTPHHATALIILFDQLSRNIYRDTPKMFAFDAKAVLIAQKLVSSQLDRTLPLIQRLFVYMPFSHAEDQSLQECSIENFEELYRDSQKQSSPNENFYKSQYEHAIKYARTIERFKRFPHRNSILKRESTPEEMTYIAA